MLPQSVADSSLPDDPVAASLDLEIASLQAQVKALKSQRELQASTILASHNTQSILASLRASQSTVSSFPAKQPPSKDAQPIAQESRTSLETNITPLLTHSTAQTNHNTTNLYRSLSTITTFHITDPDPHAVNNGRVLGIRFDVCVHDGKFVKPYYIMLTKPFGPLDGGDEERKELLRVHRHTMPPCIPLASLAQRYLPHTKGATSSTSKSHTGGKRQDLKGFVRAVRREVVAYHKRISTIKSLRNEFSLDAKPNAKGKAREEVIADITAADAEAKQVRIEWVDGRIGRVLVDDLGRVMKCVIIGEEGRDRDIERRLTRSEAGEKARMESIGARLKEGIY